MHIFTSAHPRTRLCPAIQAMFKGGNDGPMPGAEREHLFDLVRDLNDNAKASQWLLTLKDGLYFALMDQKTKQVVVVGDSLVELHRNFGKMFFS